MMMIDYKALAERVAQRAIYADNNSDPNNKTWAADLRTVVSLLNGMADAQPVAWRCEVRGDGTRPALGASDWRHYHTTTSEREAQSFIARCGDGIEGRAVPLYAAPAAPHHAMLDSHRRLVEQAIQSAEPPPGMSTHDGKARIDASVLRRMLAIIDSLPAVPQAEPKREPLSDEQIGEIQRAAYERAAQVCIETAAELRRCADGCTDGRYDWKADGADDCADAIRALGEAA